MEIKEKMTIGKAKKILRGFLAKDCYYDTPLYYAIPYLLDYITNLQQENERLKEELNGKQLREMHKINNYDYFKEMTTNWNREDFSRRCYDLCNEKVDLQQRIEKAVEYIKKHKTTITKQQADLYNCDELRNNKLKVGTFMWHVDELEDILNGRSDE